MVMSILKRSIRVIQTSLLSFKHVKFPNFRVTIGWNLERECAKEYLELFQKGNLKKAAFVTV